jgi:alkylated DNA repair dioxygenase AlkB
MNAPEFPQILLDVKSRVEDLICDYILDTTKNGTLSRGNLSFPPEFVERVKSMKSGTVEKDVYNYCLCNHYRNGEEYMGYHADDEGSLDPHTPIASVSFGITRNFDIRARKKKNGDAGGRPRLARIALGDGDLLLMFPPMQCHYEHSIPVEKRAAGERINLTFRRITTSTPRDDRCTCHSLK